MFAAGERQQTDDETAAELVKATDGSSADLVIPSSAESELAQRLWMAAAPMLWSNFETSKTQRLKGIV
jgi:hypothetical protein